MSQDNEPFGRVIHNDRHLVVVTFRCVAYVTKICASSGYLGLVVTAPVLGVIHCCTMQCDAVYCTEGDPGTKLVNVWSHRKQSAAKLVSLKDSSNIYPWKFQPSLGSPLTSYKVFFPLTFIITCFNFSFTRHGYKRKWNFFSKENAGIDLSQ